MVVYFNEFFWELLSILSLTLVGLFWLIEKISHDKYPLTELLALLVTTGAAGILWVKFELAVPTYWVGALVNLILLGAMVCVGIHFLVLILRACRLAVPRFVERVITIGALVAVFLYGVYLFALATQPQFAHFDRVVNALIRPFWIIVLLTLLARWHVSGR